MSCPVCCGQIFVADDPPRQVPCPNCDGSLMFIYPGDEEKEVLSALLLLKQEQLSLDFPEEK
jgi:hypothetical protein